MYFDTSYQNMLYFASRQIPYSYTQMVCTVFYDYVTVYTLEKLGDQ